jgi:hypothetical protein
VNDYDIPLKDRQVLRKDEQMNNNGGWDEPGPADASLLFTDEKCQRGFIFS